VSTAYVVTRRIGYSNDAVSVVHHRAFDSQLEAQRVVDELNQVFQEAMVCKLAFERVNGLEVAPLSMKQFLHSMGITFVAHGIEEITMGVIVQPKNGILLPH
jgi:hypothetical protein